MNKEDKQGIVMILVLIALIGLMIALIVNTINEKEKSYEGAVNGQIIESKKCYLKNDEAFCEIDNKVIRVDNYYEIESRK